MNELLTYFETIPTETRSLFLVGGILLFAVLETAVPLFTFNCHRGKHAFLNIVFTLITLLINLAGAGFIVKAAQFNQAQHSGLLNLFPLPIWLYVPVGLLLFDFIGAWLIHWLEHRVQWMWKFHLIHHTDTYVDVTSGLRHHPGENIFRLVFTILAVYTTGASLGLVMLYQTISAFFAHLTHANIQMPKMIDKVFSSIFVTPHFHKIHHHYTLPMTDSNYGNIFSVWDHVFRTSTHIENITDLKYGIDTHMRHEDHSNFKNLLLIPFRPIENISGAKF